MVMVGEVAIGVATVGWFVTPNITELMRVARECAASSGYKLLPGSKKKLRKLAQDLEGIKHLFNQNCSTFVNDQARLHDLWRLKDDIHNAEEVLDQFVIEIKATNGLINRRKSNKVSLSDQLVKVLRNLGETMQRARELPQFPQSSILRRAETGPSPVRDQRSFFGYHDEKDQLYSMLQQQQQQPDVNKVISIVGHGGMGKTELARQAFRDATDKFDLRIWVHAYSKHTEFDLLREVWRSVAGDDRSVDEMNISRLQDELKKLLASKRCLLVLDDVWNDEFATSELARKRTWQAVLHSFTRFTQGGSRVLMTTRAKICSATFKADASIILEGIKPDEITRLVNETANLSTDYTTGSRIQELLKQQVPKLKGSPLAALAIGDELKQQTTSSKWCKILEDMEQHLGSVLSSHLFTYLHLPPHLQHCFQFCSIFPYNWRFQPEKLTRMWMAHGFVEGTEHGPDMMEHVAIGYLYSLVDHSLFQEVDSGAGGESTYVIHEQIHWMIRMASAKNCINISATGRHGAAPRSIPTTVRHLSVTRGCLDQLKECDSRVLKNVRTLLILKNDDAGGGDTSTTIDKGILEQFKGVRVLDLTQTGLTQLPGIIGKMKHVRYLGLPSTMRTLCDQLTGLLFLPTFTVSNDDSFSRKQYLHNLELKESSALKIPYSIGKLRNPGYSNTSKSSGLVALPESFGNLTNLVHIDLSGCSGLANLPESFGNLIRLVHVNLLGCSGLGNLPESFGNLIRLVHVNLSGCSGLATLPESFQNLVNLLHIDLSGCHRLSKILEVLQKFDKLVYLDLSFWSCFQGIEKCLGRLTNLEHLNLSNPCCYLAQHRSHLQELKDGLCKLTSLRYLNLSTCLNHIIYNKSEEEGRQYIESCVSALSSLEHLDLSDNTFLIHLPKSLGDLRKLHTLDLSGCIRLKKVHAMKSLKFIALRNCRGLESYSFVVHIVDDGGAYRSNNIVQLEDVNCRELQISCLEKLDSLEEARGVRLVEKQNVEILKLCWSLGARRGSLKVEENALLGELVPPHSLQSIELHGYGGETCRPAWWIPSISSHLSNLKDITLENFPSCTILPPLGLIPNLQRLVLRGMPSITRIDIGELTGGSREPFSQLSKFTVDDMKNLREFNSGGQELDATCYTGGEEFMGFIFRPWKKFNAHHLGRDAHSPGEEFMDSLEEFDTTCYSDEKGEFMFPVIDELVIKKCPELSFGPLPPRARRLQLSDCQQVMSSWRNRGGVEEGSCAPVTTELVVERCNVPPSRPSLLHHLPGIHTLIFSHCDNMISLPEYLGDLKSLQDLKIVCCKQLKNLPDSMKQLSSLQSIHFSECERIGAFPQWFKHLTSLMLLTIDRCPAIESLPQSISELPNLKGLNISGCPRLKIWCELDQNKNKLAHIGLNFGEIGTSSSGSITSANALTPG